MFHKIISFIFFIEKLLALIKQMFITKIDIDMEKLQFKDLWMELGLDEELCKRIDYLGTSMVGVDGVRENDLSKLYDAVKEKFVGEIKDC